MLPFIVITCDACLINLCMHISVTDSKEASNLVLSQCFYHVYMMTLMNTTQTNTDMFSNYKVRLVNAEEEELMKWTTFGQTAVMFGSVYNLSLSDSTSQIYRVELKAINGAGLRSEEIYTLFYLQTEAPRLTGIIQQYM